VLGAAWQHDTYENDAAGAEYSHQAPAMFAQYDLALGPHATISTSARLERLDTYGTAFSPRFSALYRPGAWTLRASGGVGRAIPSPLIEDTESIGLSRITIADALEPEGGASGTLDVVRTFSRVSFGVTGFASRIVDPLEVRVREGRLELGNAAAPIRTRGVEFLARYGHEPFAVTLSHVELHATEGGDAGRRAVPLQPARSTGIVSMWEEEDRGRAGLELYYTGAQQLDDDPFRDRSPAYLIVGALVEWHVGRARVFVNGENLGGTRLSRYSPFVRPSRAADGRWTIDAWAPLEGRVINGGVRIAIR
jgi:outer membrane receptor for ferrienterochelin and colicins